MATTLKRDCPDEIPFSFIGNEMKVPTLNFKEGFMNQKQVNLYIRELQHKSDHLKEELESIMKTLISIVQNQQDIFEAIEGIQLDLDELKAPLKKKLKVRYKERLEKTNPSKLLKEFEEFSG